MQVNLMEVKHSRNGDVGNHATKPGESRQLFRKAVSLQRKIQQDHEQQYGNIVQHLKNQVHPVNSQRDKRRQQGCQQGRIQVQPPEFLCYRLVQTHIDRSQERRTKISVPSCMGFPHDIKIRESDQYKYQEESSMSSDKLRKLAQAGQQT
jgi:hypothetical protein